MRLGTGTATFALILLALSSAATAQVAADCFAFADGPHAAGDLPLFPLSGCVAVSGRYAYLTGTANGLEVIDLADPGAPWIAGCLAEPGATGSLAVAGTRVIVMAAGGRLHVIDIAEPTHPRVVGSLDTGLPEAVVAVDGDRACVASAEAGVLMVVDLGDSAAPQVLGSASVTGSTVRDLAVTGGYAYLADDQAGLRIFDVSGPGAPRHVGQLGSGGQYAGWSVAIAGGLAYLASYPQDCLYVIDVSVPAAPLVIDTLTGCLRASRVVVAEDRLFLLDSQRGVTVLDLADPQHPVRCGTATVEGYGIDLAATGDLACVAKFALGLEVLDISRTEAIPIVGQLALTGEGLRGVAATADKLVTAAGHDGVAVIDISDPSRPLVAGIVDTPGCAVGAAIDGNLACVADSSSLQVVDLANPAGPLVVGAVEIAGEALGVALSGTIAWLAASHEGLLAVDVAVPAEPRIIGRLDSQGCLDVAIAGAQAFLAGWGGWFVTADISDPTVPREIGRLDLLGVRSVAVSGDYAYLARGNAGLAIVDVSDAARPSLVSELSLPSHCLDVAVRGGFAYVACEDVGLIVVDVADPHQPRLGPTSPFPCLAGVAMTVTQVAVVDWTAGLSILPVACRAAAAVGEPWPSSAGVQLAAWPNPSSRALTITFTAGKGGPVSAAVYDVAGRLVQRLPAREMFEGRNELTWDGRFDDGRAAPAGVYLVRLETPGGPATTRVAKVR